MKKINLILIIAVIVGIISCKKESSSVVVPAKIITSVIDSIQKTFTKSKSDGSSGKYAVGYDFEALNAGKINKIGILTPSSGNYKLMLYSNDNYRKDSVNINITVADTGKLVYTNITPFEVSKEESIRVTFNDEDRPQYLFSKVGGMNQVFGDIDLRWYVYKNTDESTFNSLFSHNQDYLFGGIDVVFTRD